MGILRAAGRHYGGRSSRHGHPEVAPHSLVSAIKVKGAPVIEIYRRDCCTPFPAFDFRRQCLVFVDTFPRGYAAADELLDLRGLAVPSRRGQRMAVPLR
jgi:hypothetical protein